MARKFDLPAVPGLIPYVTLTPEARLPLHKIKKVIAITHHDCGAARIAFGADKVATATVETETHKMALADFRKQVAERQPTLPVETGLMALDGKIEMFA